MLIHLYRYKPDVNNWNSYQLDTALSERVTELHYRAERVGASWPKCMLSALQHDVGRRSDFPALNNYSKIPIVSPAAWEILKPVIGQSVEALPVQTPDGGYFLLNVLELVDCVNEEQSQLTKNRVTGRVSRIYKYSFKYELIRGKHIFKTPLKSGAELLVDDRFRHAVEAHALQGLCFQELEYADRAPD